MKEQRFLAEPVSRQQHDVLITIPDRKGEHATQLGYEIGTPYPPAEQQYFRVACGAEYAALRLQFAPQFSEIVDLAVESDPNRLVQHLHRLCRARIEVDDRKSAMGEARRPDHLDPAVVGTTMPDLLDHPAQMAARFFRIERPAMAQNSRNPTHRIGPALAVSLAEGLRAA